jgi:ABC-type uncharacterized transport system permease subunit
MIISGLLLALSVLLLLHKLPKLHKQALNHPAISDITITMGVLVLGLVSLTFSGLMVGIIAGVALSIYFSIAPKVKLPSLKHKERLVGTTVNFTIAPGTTIEDVEKFIAKYDKQQKPLTLEQHIKSIKLEQKL